jgi:hypothetical protein
MQYTASTPFTGDADKALRLAESSLAAVGFQLTARTPTSLEAIGPGMNNSRESALVGASHIVIHHGRGELTLDAELGGAERLGRFAKLFPLGLVLVMAVVLSVVFLFVFGPGSWIISVGAATGLFALPWLVVGPLMAGSIHRRTCRGLDAFLASMVLSGESGGASGSSKG